jgi:peptide deformylase
MEEGVGLAAPQVGHNLRMFLMMKDLPDEKKVLEYQEVINPVILQASKETNLDFEGCLSIPEYVGIVRRSNEIEVQYQDLHDQVHRHFLKDFPARIFQHELDHLNGILYIDKMKHKSLIHHKEFEQLEWEQINKLLV